MGQVTDGLRTKQLGLLDYQTVFSRMQSFTAARDTDTPDEIWLLEHPPVYTLGLGARDGHLHQPGEIPVVKTDRGGQVTYHGPGQLIVYVLVDLKRRGYGVRSLVQRIEQALIDYLASQSIIAARRAGAPGVYVDDAKIAALGLRVKNGCSYHGLALNVDMDLAPFERIDPCGYPGLAVTRLSDHGLTDTMPMIADQLLGHLSGRLESALVDQPMTSSTMENVAHD